MKVINIAWWICYVMAALILQRYTVGVDFLLPGVIVALQERKFIQFVIILFSFIFIQEGIGTMPFGNVFLWYFLVIIFFFAWQWFFEVESFTFIVLLSIALSVSHYYIVSTFAAIQDIYIDYESLRDECFYQMILTPILWHTINYFRRGIRYAS